MAFLVLIDAENLFRQTKLDQSCEARSKPLRKRFSETESEKACDHNDHYGYSDDVENIHCFAPIEE